MISHVPTSQLIWLRNEFIGIKLRSIANAKQRGKGTSSEIIAKISLARAYDLCRSHREEAYHSLKWRYGLHFEQDAARSYIAGERSIGCPMFDFVRFKFWTKHASIAKTQLVRSEQGEQSYSRSWLRYQNFYRRPVYLEYLRYFLVPQISFINECPQAAGRYPLGIELIYLYLTGFIAAEITIKPELARALSNAHSGLSPTAALMWELIGEVADMTPALLQDQIKFEQLPMQAASSIQGRHRVSLKEITSDQYDFMVEQSIDPRLPLDTAKTVIDRDEVFYYLNNLTPQRRRVALLKADGYEYQEIAEALNIGLQSVKTHTTLMKQQAENLCLARN